ncbi:MAG: hypothetical protein NW237_07115 [Cyanobacteriota bacterium]|nr:hypothetical protein [Cyanobacteriota bacterium]
METQSLTPLDQLQAFAQDDGKPLQVILDEAIFLLRRQRIRHLDRLTRRDPQLVEQDFGTTPAAWARQDIEEDRGLMEDLGAVFHDPEQWQLLVQTIQRQGHPSSLS